MKAKRWTLGVVLAAAVSLIGLIQADASPFSTHVLSDDLANTVNGKAPKDPALYNNNGHGNNEDGVDSSNPGDSMEGMDTDSTVDDEITTKGSKGNKK